MVINLRCITCHHLLITVLLKQQSRYQSSIRFIRFLFFFFRFISFTSGAILAVLILLTIYDEDVLNVEHMLTLMTCLGVVLGICRSLIPDEVIRLKLVVFFYEDFLFLECCLWSGANVTTCSCSSSLSTRFMERSCTYGLCSSRIWTNVSIEICKINIRLKSLLNFVI